MKGHSRESKAFSFSLIVLPVWSLLIVSGRTLFNLAAIALAAIL